MWGNCARMLLLGEGKRRGDETSASEGISCNAVDWFLLKREQSKIILSYPVTFMDFYIFELGCSEGREERPWEQG